MLSIIAHQVFAEIKEISRSDDLLAKRREVAEQADCSTQDRS
jgi:hypothetical protein